MRETESYSFKMKNILKLLFSGFILLFISISFAETIQCTKVEVYDGDTINCLTAENQQIKVKLYQIDAPELNQPYGQQAKAKLEEYAAEHKIELYCHGTNETGIKECRAFYRSGGGCGSINSPSIGYCLVPYEINSELISKGLAWYRPSALSLKEEPSNKNFTIYNHYCSQNPCDDYASKENSAKIYKRGLWAQPDPIPPWEWRRQ